MRDLVNFDENKVTMCSVHYYRGNHMHAYSDVYLNDVVENQGKLFDYIAQAYVNTMDANELWEYFSKTDGYTLKSGATLEGFMPDWISKFYAYYQWYYNISSSVLADKIPIEFLIKAYPGLHDLTLELAVQKVGEV